MPRPRSLTHSQIAVAALAVLDRDGLDGLSMRAVAKELGVGTMSLYRYVTDRGQLEGLIVDVVLRSVPLDLPAKASPHRRLVLLAERVREAVGAHSAVVSLLLTHRHLSTGSRQWGEVVLRVLADAGFTGEKRVIAFRAYLSYLMGAMRTGYFSPLSGTGTDVLTELPEDEYPVLAETARHARGITASEEFRQGLDLLLAGFGLTP
ncbi:TetR/AcrR family transcriptional regulator [Amycolatopsis sp.]|uniref:TetR/AcrR family transcriptional regulator n=1 Tax=Amycolatopsis sp. TaxID=37632 RepID=UPI002BDFE9A8|nr:TetR/AcrR family transcriptional regulator C-terminal domain-containing protein [Amycolatopsis sp.]HVV13172.1 TetR/AcrR family transcriptional regulator C-terminal domain-containing protein [Amycolatopsis sp.]